MMGGPRGASRRWQNSTDIFDDDYDDNNVKDEDDAHDEDDDDKDDGNNHHHHPIAGSQCHQKERHLHLCEAPVRTFMLGPSIGRISTGDCQLHQQDHLHRRNHHHQHWQWDRLDVSQLAVWHNGPRVCLVWLCICVFSVCFCSCVCVYLCDTLRHVYVWHDRSKVVWLNCHKMWHSAIELSHDLLDRHHQKPSDVSILANEWQVYIRALTYNVRHWYTVEKTECENSVLSFPKPCRLFTFSCSIIDDSLTSNSRWFTINTTHTSLLTTHHHHPPPPPHHHHNHLHSDFTDSALGSADKSPLPYGNFQLRESTMAVSSTYSLNLQVQPPSSSSKFILFSNILLSSDPFQAHDNF